MRACYRFVVGLHPRSFRRRFAEEMLWIFDQASGEQGARHLLADAFISLGRQWVVRSGLWKFAAAAAGGLLTLIPALVFQMPRLRGLDSVKLDSTQGFFVVTALSAFLAISFTVILSVTWFRFSRRRGA